MQEKKRSILGATLPSYVIHFYPIFSVQKKLSLKLPIKMLIPYLTLEYDESLE